MSADWTTAYIATSALLREPLDATMESIGAGPGDADALRALPGPASALASTLRAGSREVRAQALARALSEVVLALDASRLA